MRFDPAKIEAGGVSGASDEFFSAGGGKSFMGFVGFMGFIVLHLIRIPHRTSPFCSDLVNVNIVWLSLPSCFVCICHNFF